MGGQSMSATGSDADEPSCVICYTPADHQHHVDGNDSNNSSENIVWVCDNCQEGIHHGSKPRYLVWHALLKPDARHMPLPSVGMNEIDRKRDRRAIRLNDQMREAYAEATTVATARQPASDSNTSDGDVRVKIGKQETSFTNLFTVKSVSMGVDGERRHIHRTEPVEMVFDDADGWILRLPEIDDYGSQDVREAAYEAFWTTLRKEQVVRGSGRVVAETDTQPNRDEWERIA